jgi:hypothetical protein
MAQKKRRSSSRRKTKAKSQSNSSTVGSAAKAAVAAAADRVSAYLPAVDAVELATKVMVVNQSLRTEVFKNLDRPDAEKARKQLQKLINKRKDKGDDVEVWENVKDYQLVEAIVNKQPDPRPDIETQCIFIGAASASAKKEEIVSYLYPVPEKEDKFYKVCFSLPELATLVSEKATKTGLVNPFLEEMTRKLPGLEVPAKFDRTFVDLVRFMRKAVDYHRRSVGDVLNDERDKIIQRVLVQHLETYFKENPKAINAGGVVGWTKEMFKAVMRKGYAFGQWVMQHPVWATAIAIISKAVRLLLCAYISGIPGPDVGLIFESLMQVTKDNPLVTTIISALKIIYGCARDLMSANPFAIATCAGKAVVITGSTTWKFGSWVVNFMISSTKSIVEGIVGKTWAPLVKWLFYPVEWTGTCISTDASTCVLAIWQSGMDIWHGTEKGSRRSKQALEVGMKDQMQKAFLEDFNGTMFVVLTFLVPVKFLGRIANMFLTTLAPQVMGPVNAFLEKVGSNSEWMTIGDVWYYMVQAVAVPRAFNSLLQEVYAWVMDVGFGCFFKSLRRRIAGAEPSKDRACCFRDTVREISLMINAEGSLGLKHYLINAGRKVGEWMPTWSDCRLKTLVLPRPVYAIPVPGKRRFVRVYLYQWDRAACTRYGIECRARRRLVFGVMAQEIRTLFPDAVETDPRSKLLYVNLAKLPCDILLHLAYMNREPMPPLKRCGYAALL